MSWSFPAACIQYTLLRKTPSRHDGTECAFNTSRCCPAQWPMAALNHANTRYSDLDQITAENVKGLQVAWKFDTGINRGQEAALIVVDNTMFVVTPYPNILYALDVTKKGAVKWKYEPK